ncbi:FMN-binding protein [Catenuloplanes atrovinosus]|uniref:Uncharacterized protein with FMN-binding domain n=1 Tax=Catenuloplanes atrovinosus TaxID=137266 RepID=A0AAE3YQF1_9ACTN|nr:FMN-binding protein [Catenuloplanes atrovinosus]MDR7276752.1 uncharacterized protein with FMN-binding domain [Catenuloplanes atrovinosus]
MRRSTAAVLGTLAGVGMIFGVRMAAPTQIVAVAETPAEDAPADDAGGDDAGNQEEEAPPAGGGEEEDAAEGGGGGGGLTDGDFQGAAAKNPYGTIQVTITVEDGKITAADATYPTAGNSATINPPAIEKLNESAVNAESADDVDAVSGATFTTDSYKESLQAALDEAQG